MKEKEAVREFEQSLEQYRNLGQYWSLGTDTETGEADRVSGRKIANDQTGEESGEQAESEKPVEWSDGKPDRRKAEDRAYL